MKVELNLTEAEVLDIIHDHVLDILPEELVMAEDHEIELNCNPGPVVVYATCGDPAEEEVEQPW